MSLQILTILLRQPAARQAHLVIFKDGKSHVVKKIDLNRGGELETGNLKVEFFARGRVVS